MASKDPKKEKKIPGVPGRKKESFSVPVIKELRDVQTLRVAPTFVSLYALQKRINEYFEVYLPGQNIAPSPASLAKFLNFSSVKALQSFQGNKGGNSEKSYKALIDKAILRVEEILCHLAASRQSFGGAIFLLKSQCGYSETEIIKLESSEGAKLDKSDRADLKAVAKLIADRKRARLNGQDVSQVTETLQ